MNSSLFALVIFFLVYTTGHASKDSKKLKLKSILAKPGKLYSAKRANGNLLDHSSALNLHQSATKSFKKLDTNVHNSKKEGSLNIKLKKSKFKSNLAAKKSALSSRKRQNVFTGDPSQQRLYHIDETGTLHRHEVGPEEFSTPEGRTETFSNDRLLTEENLTNLRPSQATATVASTRQMLGPQKGPARVQEFPAGRPVAFVKPPPLAPGPPRRYYLMTSMHNPSDPNARDQAPSNEPNRSPRLQRVYIHRVPYSNPLPRYGNTPYLAPYQQPYPASPMAHQVPVAFPFPIANPPKIQNVPYPVPVPVQSPPQIQIQRVPVAVPQPYAVPEIHKVPVPVPVQMPPQIRIQKVPVPVPVPQSYPQVPYPRIPMERGFVNPGPIVPVPVGLTECETKPCRNGGTCYSVDDIQSYRCHCPSGFKGKHCEDTSKCHPNPCENFGECTVLQSGYECSCRRGFRGTRCEVRDQCHPSPCRNGGSCTSVANEYACSCIYGFIGKNCEVESKCFPLNPCKHSGVCHEDHMSYKCTCTQGWEGISCEIPDPCSRNPCFHGGACRPVGSTFTCLCQRGFLGKTCQIESQCHSGNPCRNGGQCHEHALDGYRCRCNSRWTGEHCEIPSYSSY